MTSPLTLLSALLVAWLGGALLASPCRADPADPSAGALARWEALLDTPREALAKHDLSWIPAPASPTTKGAFLRAEPGIKRASLRYLGYRLPGSLEPYKSVHSLPRELRHPYHVYRYREFTVLTETDGRREQLCVYALARALELLRARFPREFEVLFRGPQTPAAQLKALRRYDPKKNVSFLNLSAAYAFVFKGRSEAAIAASGYTLGTRVEVKLRDGPVTRPIGVFRNVATTYLNFAAIQGYRSAKLYGQREALANFLRYLRDGLLETLVHEALHNLLRRDKNVRPLFWALTDSIRKSQGGVVGKEVEEAFVSNVSRRLLKGKGLSDEVSRFYGRRLEKTQRKRLGLVPGSETPAGLKLRALLKAIPGPKSKGGLLAFDLVPPR